MNKENYIHRSSLHTTQGIRKTVLLSWQDRCVQEKPDMQQFECGRPASSVVAAQCILVIDDSETIRTIVTTWLAQKGYKVQAFPDGIEAMKWLAKPGSQPPDLVLVDLGLPKMDGYEVIRTIKMKPRFAQTRYVILSRRDGVIDRLKGRLAGAMTYLTKPFTMQVLLKTVQTVLLSEPEHEEMQQHRRT